MQFLAEYGLFLAKTTTLVVSLLILIAGIAAISGRIRSQKREHLSIKKLNDKYDEMAETIKVEVLKRRHLKNTSKKKNNLKKMPRKTQNYRVRASVSLYCILKVI